MRTYEEAEPGTLVEAARTLRKRVADLFHAVGDTFDPPPSLDTIRIPRVFLDHVAGVTAAAAIVAPDASTQDRLTGISNVANALLLDGRR